MIYFLLYVGAVRLSVRRVLSLACKVLAVMVLGGREPQRGDRLEPLAVGHQLLHRGHSGRHHGILTVEPGNLE